MPREDRIKTIIEIVKVLQELWHEFIDRKIARADKEADRKEKAEGLEKKVKDLEEQIARLKAGIHGNSDVR